MRTTPAMSLPSGLMMPEAVRISVSMRSFSTGARAGRAVSSSVAVAARQEDFVWAGSEGCRERVVRSARKTSFILRVSLEMDYAALDGDGCGVGAVADA